MGEVNYKLLAIIIARQIKKEVNICVTDYRAKAEELDPNDPKYMENILSLSAELTNQCKQIAANIIKEYSWIEKKDILC